MKRVFALALLFLSWLPPAWAQSPCGAVPDHIIAVYYKGASGEDKARLKLCFGILQKVDDVTLTAFENVVRDLANAPVDEVSGVANPKHWVRANSGWTSDPELVKRYINGLDFFRNADGSLKPGLALKVNTQGSTTNVRRVAGGSGSKAEAWEVVSTHEMVLRGYFTRDEVLEFGPKIILTGGGQVEADVWVARTTGELILIDQKHTLGGDPISTVSEELIRKWIRGLQDGDFHKVLVPVNQPPSAPLEAKVRELLLVAGRSEDEIQFVADLSPF